MNIEDTDTTTPRQMESIKLDNLLINFTTEFQQIWESTGAHSEPAAFWHPTPAPDLLPGYFPLGDVIVPGHENINRVKVVAVVREGDSPSDDPARGKALSRPDGYEQVWKDSGSGAKKNCSLWRPIPPDGYVALGLVCSMGYEKPSLHAVRCIREDLVVVSYVGDMIWSEEGSGAKQKFNAWEIALPAAAAGEIYFAPGTFVGDSSHFRYRHALTYSLRMKIPLQINTPPVAPAISDFKTPLPPETSEATQVAMIPWFAVDDSPASASDALSEATYYRLERKDHYKLVGQGHNTEDTSKLFKWTAAGGRSHEEARIFSSITSIKFDTQWRAEASDDRPIQFSAKLSEEFTHTKTVSNGWKAPSNLAVAAIVPKNKMLAVYQLESHYDLLNEDGTQVAVSFAYTDSDSLHWIEYPAEDSPMTPRPESITDPSVATDIAP